jgi:hypothetical protein
VEELKKMAINLSQISSTTTAALSLSNLLLATPKAVVGYQPKLPPNADGSVNTSQQPPTFLFQIEGTQKIVLQSEITDHYVEDNTPVEDNIALRPEVYTTQGFIGELNDVPPPGLDIIKEVANRLTVIGAYAPQVSATALEAYNQAFAAYQLAKNVADTAVAAWSSIGNATGLGAGQKPQNKQQIAFQKWYGYWKAKTLFTVQTPWAVFDTMAIQQITATQDEETKEVSSFEVIFKAFRTVRTIIETRGFGSNSLDGRAASQGAELTDYGVGSLGPPESLASGISSMLG